MRHLDGYPSVERNVVRQIDFAKPAFAQCANDAIAADVPWLLGSRKLGKRPLNNVGVLCETTAILIFYRWVIGNGALLQFDGEQLVQKGRFVQVWRAGHVLFNLWLLVLSAGRFKLDADSVNANRVEDGRPRAEALLLAGKSSRLLGSF